MSYFASLRSSYARTRQLSGRKSPRDYRVPLMLEHMESRVLLSATHLLVGLQPTNAETGLPTAFPVTVEVVDNNGKLQTSSSATITFTVNSGAADGLGGTTTVKAKKGIATFDNLIFSKTGDYTLTATSGSLAPTTTGTISVAQGPGVPTLTFTQQPVGNASGSALTSPVVVTLADENGTPVTVPANVTLALVSGPKGGKLTGTLTATTVNGVATFNGIGVNKSGDYVIKASVGNVTTTSNAFTMGQSSGSGSSQPGSLTIGTQPVGNPTGGSLTGPIVVNVLDASGNPVTKSTPVTLKILTGPDKAKISGKLTVKTVNGIATFDTVNLSKGGTYTLQAKSKSLTVDTASFDMGGPATATSLHFLQQPSDSVAGVILSPPVTVQVLDQYGNVLTTDKSTVKLTIATGPTTKGKFSAKVKQGVATFSKLKFTVAGDYTLTASDKSLTTATSDTFTILAAPAAKLAFTQLPDSGSAAAGPFTVGVTAVDKFGNTAALNTGTVTLAVAKAPKGVSVNSTSTAAVAGVATFDGLGLPQAGRYQLLASQDLLPSVKTKSLSFT